MLTLQTLRTLADIGEAAIGYGLAPLLVLYLRRSRGIPKRAWLSSSLSAIYITWLILNIYQWYVEAPVHVKVMLSDDKYFYNDSKADTVTLLLGWILPALSCLVLWIGWLLWRVIDWAWIRIRSVRATN